MSEQIGNSYAWDIVCTECGEIADSGSADFPDASSRIDMLAEKEKEALTLLCKRCKNRGECADYMYGDLYFPSQVLPSPENAQLEVFAWNHPIGTGKYSYLQRSNQKSAIFTCIRRKNGGCLYEEGGQFFEQWPGSLRWLPLDDIADILSNLGDIFEFLQK